MAGKKGMKKGKGSRRPLNKQEQMMMMQDGDGFIDAVKNVVGKVNTFLKDTKILSKLASMVPAQTPYIGPVAKVGAPVLASLGYGQSGGAKTVSGGPLFSDGVGVSQMNRNIGLNSVINGAGKKRELKVLRY